MKAPTAMSLLTMCVIVIASSGAPAGAQEAAAGRERDEKTAEASPKERPQVPLEVRIVFHRFQGERKLASLPYVVPVVSGDPAGGRLRMGVNVPLRTNAADGASIVYKSVGTNIDCSADSLPDGRYRLRLTLEQTSIYTDAETTTAGPVIREFSTRVSPILRGGETQQYTSATDPISGEVVRVEVSLLATR